MPQPKPTIWRVLVIVKCAGDGRCVSKRLESVGAFLYQLRWRLCRSAGEKAKACRKPELLGSTDHLKDGKVFGQIPPQTSWDVWRDTKCEAISNSWSLSEVWVMSLAPKKCIHKQWYHFDCHMCAYQNEQPLSLHVSFCSQGIEATSLNLTCQTILNHLSGLPILSVAVGFQTSIIFTIFLRMPRCGSCGKSWSQWRSLSLTSCSGMEGRGCCSWWSSVRVSVGCRRSPLICDFPRFELPQAGITDHLIGVGTNNAQKYVHLDLARGLYNILMILKHLLHNHSGSIWPMRRRSRPGGSSAEMGRGEGVAISSRSS